MIGIEYSEPVRISKVQVGREPGVLCNVLEGIFGLHPFDYPEKIVVIQDDNNQPKLVITYPLDPSVEVVNT